VDVNYAVYLREPPGDDLRDALVHAGARLVSALTGWALPPGTSWDSLAPLLAEHAAEFDIYYEYVPGSRDEIASLAAYVGLERFVEDETYADPNEPLLFYDDTGTGLLGTEPATQALNALTTGLQWAVTDVDPDLFRLVQATALPEPVVVPRAMFLGEDANGVWAVQSDGRELLSSANRKAVQSLGLVLAPTCLVNDRVLRWRRSPIFGGRVIEELRRQDIGGLSGQVLYLESI
jgi:hypothetical protein